ncbi:uncharacterized protein At5g01610-like [Rutidosis leptorrhynchoides]|uniref:uncharacterized protein At5g01610-like n=1 Tax=Rutidosis leptorrhynchoides TaxID=125765 RepID=UPI003A99A02B
MTLAKTRMETLYMFSLLFSCFIIFSSAIDDDQPSVYEVLQSYNLPVGILPKGAVDYNLDRTSGHFSVNFNGVCHVNVEGYKLKYFPTISGVVSNNTLAGLNGVEVKVSMFWIKIVSVTRNGDALNLRIGKFKSKSLPVSTFLSSPECNN